LRDWIHGLGVETFVGTSGRVFPKEMKAAPLLRAWLHRLREHGMRFHMRHRWLGWDDDGALRFATESSPLPNPLPQAGEGANEKIIHFDAVVLALGGASWPQLGSDGTWVATLAARGIDIAPLRPSNCGFEIAWSDHFRERHAGEPLKSVVATFTPCTPSRNAQLPLPPGEGRGEGDLFEQDTLTLTLSHGERELEQRIAKESIVKQGECLIDAHGIEGGLIYALSAALRDEIEARGAATLHLDLMPDWTLPRIEKEVMHPRGSRSLSSHLQSRLGLKGAKANLLREVLSAEQMQDANLLAQTIKRLPLRLTATRPLSEAISTAGGVRFEELDADLMLHKLPGVFVCGEMLDWEAPTGGYLLSACFASGYAAGNGVLRSLQQP
jgi:predicted flavoprotein YhiN